MTTSHDTGARARGLLGIAIAAAMLGACTREVPGEPVAKTEADAPVVATKPGEAAAVTAEVSPSSLGAGLDDALHRSIVPPPAGGTTYRVDPFVAALVYAAAEREAARWFAPYAGTPAKVDYEVRGFMVTGAGERAGLLRLGLREGDIVEQVNGVSATDATAIRGALAGSDQGVTVGVFREDYSLVLGYRFEPGLAWLRTREEAGIDAQAPAADVADDSGAPVIAAADTPGLPSGEGGATPPRSSGRGPASGSKPGTKPSSPGSAPAKPGTSTPGTSTPGSSPVSCASDSSCTIRKSYFDSMTSSPSKLESQAKIVPAIRNDVFSGYKLSWIRPGSAIDQMGFRSGDKITHINGKDLTDDAQAFALYLSLSSTRAYTIKYVRGTQTRTKSVDVK